MNKNLLLDFSLELQGADTLDNQQAVLQRTVQSLGFKSFLYALIPSANLDDTAEFIACTNFNPDWLTHYANMEMFQDDYAALHCINKSSTLLWSDMFANIDQGFIGHRYKRTADATRDWAHGNGLSLPIQHFGTSSAALSLVADADMTAAEADIEFSRHRDSLQLIANAFHSNVDRSALSQRHFDISPREIEVLKWLLDGYLVKQIAHKTGRSVHTLNKQIQSAKLRLKCKTTSQAVARAVILELI